LKNQTLNDVSISRKNVSWGIQLPFDQEHTTYVWVDAFLNYLTGLGWDGDEKKLPKFWPVDINMIGKDILRFHAIYWPIILHCLGLEMPKKIFAHPWLLFSNDKMSKSKGNIVYAEDLISKYGVDAVRFYLLHDIPFGSDGNYTEELFIDSINTNLANVLGNLVNRTIGMINKYFDGEVSNKGVSEKIDNNLIKEAESLYIKVENYMNKLEVPKALDSIFDLFRSLNKYIDETTPWILAKDDSKKDRLATVLYNLIEGIRIGTVLLRPFIPETTEKIFKQINTDNTSYDSVKEFGGYKSGTKVGTPEVLFQRIETK
jgi:methionyl-tRNA synthetase